MPSYIHSKEIVMYEKQMNRAYRLYKSYKTSTWEYKRLAEALGFSSSGELNARLNVRWNAELVARARRKAA
jgi:hypothetical protein